MKSALGARICGAARSLRSAHTRHGGEVGVANLFDHILLNWLDGYAGLAQPRECALDLFLAALEFDGDQTHLLGHAGAPNVEHEIELLHQMIKDRLLDELARIREVVALVNALSVHLRSDA